MQISTNVPVIPVQTEQRVLTRLTDMFVTVLLDTLEFTARLVSIPPTSDWSINAVNDIILCNYYIVFEYFSVITLS